MAISSWVSAPRLVTASTVYEPVVAAPPLATYAGTSPWSTEAITFLTTFEAPRGVQSVVPTEGQLWPRGNVTTTYVIVEVPAPVATGNVFNSDYLFTQGI